MWNRSTSASPAERVRSGRPLQPRAASYGGRRPERAHPWRLDCGSASIRLSGRSTTVGSLWARSGSSTTATVSGRSPLRRSYSGGLVPASDSPAVFVLGPAGTLALRQSLATGFSLSFSVRRGWPAHRGGRPRRRRMVPLHVGHSGRGVDDARRVRGTGTSAAVLSRQVAADRSGGVPAAGGWSVNQPRSGSGCYQGRRYRRDRQEGRARRWNCLPPVRLLLDRPRSGRATRSRLMSASLRVCSADVLDLARGDGEPGNNGEQANVQIGPCNRAPPRSHRRCGGRSKAILGPHSARHRRHRLPSEDATLSSLLLHLFFFTPSRRARTGRAGWLRWRMCAQTGRLAGLGGPAPRESGHPRRAWLDERGPRTPLPRCTCFCPALRPYARPAARATARTEARRRTLLPGLQRHPVPATNHPPPSPGPL